MFTGFLLGAGMVAVAWFVAALLRFGGAAAEPTVQPLDHVVAAILRREQLWQTAAQMAADWEARYKGAWTVTAYPALRLQAKKAAHDFHQLAEEVRRGH